MKNKAQIMHAKDTISAVTAECYVTIGGNRWNFLHVIDLEASIKKNKAKVPILGKIGKGNKSTTWEGSGKFKTHYVSSKFREIVKHWKDTGEDMYFDIQITNEDPTSAAGRQTIILKDCNLDDVVLAKFDADGEILDEECSFTFEDFEMPERFKPLEGM